MKAITYSFADVVSENFYWFNAPQKFRVGNGLEIWTDPGTDFWQRTHYGFRNDNGHCLLHDVDGDFTVSTQVENVMYHRVSCTPSCEELLLHQQAVSDNGLRTAMT